MKSLSFIKENLGLKIISLILGIIVWFNATTDEISVYTIPFKLSYTFQGLGDSLVIINKLPDYINASIKTSGKTYLRIKFSEKVVYKNLSNLRYGINEIKFDYEDLPISLKDIEIFNINPRTILVQVDRVQKRKVPVKVVSVLLKNSTLFVRSINVNPETTTIIGPASIVNKIQFLPLEPIEVMKSVDTLFVAKVEKLNNDFIRIENGEGFKVRLSIDTLYKDSIFLRSKKFEQRIKIAYLRPSDYQVSHRSFNIKTTLIDSLESLLVYKLEVEATPPLKILSVEPEMVTVKKSN
uniref:YbbR-like domain-containing protein n=1 Tax=candidate division WOR-3 bacterium TaxID=2052148 RepID=A0A7V4E4X9_UNCW3